MKSKRKQKRLLIFLLAAAVVCSVCVFCLPIEKNGTVWIAYISEMLALVLQIPLFRPAGKNAARLKSKALGLPIYTVGYLYIAFQTAVGLSLFALNAVLKPFPAWAAAVICVIIIIAAFVCSTVKEEKVKNTDYLNLIRKEENPLMKSLFEKTQNIALNAYDENSKHMLMLVSESFRYSDPCSDPKTRDIELKLKSAVARLDRAVSERGDIVELCAEISELLNNRNELCKSINGIS